MCLCYCSMTVSVLIADENAVSIWTVGQKDGSFAEFALAGVGDNGQFQERFKQGVTFSIGEDSPSEDWSYIHPGSVDNWAGNRKHPFSIQFDLNEKKYPAYVFNIHLTAAHRNRPPAITVQINDKTWDIQTQSGPGDQAMTDPKAGGQQTHSLFFRGNVLNAGKNQITITTKGSWMIYDALELAGVSGVADITALKASVRSGYYRRPEGPSRLIDIAFIGDGLMKPAKVQFQCQDEITTRIIDPGDDILKSAQIYVTVPSSEQTLPAKIVLKNGTNEIAAALEISPVRKWEVHLIHQTHLDIGYTHPQEEVLQRQVDHLEKALSYIDESRDYPEELRFKWHPEGMWAIEEFLRTKPKDDTERLIAATRTRDIHIDAMYAQPLTGLYSEEELFELVGVAVRYGKKYGVVVDSAMISDIPGCTWGLVSALAHNGIKYISAGPNRGHRVGRTFEWGNQPFWWVSPSGKHKVLFWMDAQGYSWFYGSPVGHSLLDDEEKILNYISDLETQKYPYDMIQLRYIIGQDNGPPNPMLSEAVKKWNEKYVWPKLIVSRNSEMMQKLEKQYGDQLPVVRGDFTPYWEDGAASTAADVGISRRAVEQLVQAQTLWTILDRETYPHDEFERAWNKLIMYDEHTWGAHNSISAPDSEFAVQQAQYKQKYALDGAAMSADLLNRAAGTHMKDSSGVIDIYNTLNWERSETVFLSPEKSKVGDCVVDSSGKPVASQRLASGQLAFFAEDIPAFGAKRFMIKKGQAVTNGAGVKVTDHSLTNDCVSVTIDQETGYVNCIKYKDVAENLVDSSKEYGMNDYLYILGRDPSKNNMRIDSPVKISIIDNGPLVGTVKIESDAPGAEKLTRTIRVSHSSAAVEMINIVDKIKERRPEGVYFDFPFNVPGGTMKIDTPWAVFEPEKDQLRGANRNFFCTQRFVDISNDQYGVTWMPIDAPIVQWDPIQIAGGNGTQYFRTTLTPNQTIHSWVMNNHWETNYEADQEGAIPFRYVVWPHAGGYDGQQVQRVSRAVHQPLLAVSADPSIPVTEPKLQVQGSGIVVTSLKPCRDGSGCMVRLFNTSKENSTASLKWKNKRCTFWISNSLEERVCKATNSVEMASQEIVTLRIEE